MKAQKKGRRWRRDGDALYGFLTGGLRVGGRVYLVGNTARFSAICWRFGHEFIWRNEPPRFATLEHGKRAVEAWLSRHLARKRVTKTQT